MKKVGVLVWGLACAISGCNIGSGIGGGGGGGGGPSVAIHAVNIEPSTVADGGSFTVTWDVSYNNGQGVFPEIGLYLGAAGDLATASARDSRSVFVFADTGGAPNHPGMTTTCTRTGARVQCTPGLNSSREVPAGPTEVTFRLCSENVLSSASQVCDVRTLSMNFP